MKGKVRYLKPIDVSPAYFDEIEAEIVRWFRREIYLPIVRELKLAESGDNAILKNSFDDLIRAIKKGQVIYERGHFKGKFSAEISKELKKRGATWDTEDKSWRLPQAQMDHDIMAAVGTARSRFVSTSERIMDKLSKIVPEEVAKKMSLENLFDQTVFKVNKDVEANVKAITVAPKLTKEQQARIASEYNDNIKLAIEDFTRKETQELRNKVQSNAEAGIRYESLAREIEKSYGITRRKAKFLARQETSLLMTKFAQVRYQDAGVNEYEWQCVHMPHDKTPDQHTLGNVRYYHGLLDKKIFRWDNPPVVNAKGDRKNPGQDYNCRCKARPIVRF
jgi:SPP1 gp7 family putative phage head morphogenesis protein